jgi:cytochrome c-type biogenesis protein CcmE
VARKRSPARLVIALAIAAILAVFLLYTSLAGGGTPSLRPSQLAGHAGEVSLAGIVLAPVTGDAHAGGLRFRLKDFDGPAKVAVVYTGTVPDLFKPTRHIVVTGRVQNGTFVANPGSMVTKCPSKYAPAKKRA